MICPKCKTDNVEIQMVNEVKLKNQHHGIIWWLFVGWWWLFVKWIFLTLPALFVKIFIPRKQRAINKTRQMYVCQKCGNAWKGKIKK